MKIIIYLGAFILLITKVYAQDHYSVTPMQAGTINFNAGNTVIDLSADVKEVLNDKSLDASYYVVFTPIDNSIIPSVSNKNNSSFAAVFKTDQQSKLNGHLDYIVFVKRKVIQLNPTKNLNKSVIHN
jgi:hypothetical protein